MEIPEFIDSKFRLAILAAKRAKQIVSGGKKRIESEANNPLTIAIDEIYQGKIRFKLVEDKPDLEMITGSITEEEEDALNSSAKDFLLGKDEPEETDDTGTGSETDKEE